MIHLFHKKEQLQYMPVKEPPALRPFEQMTKEEAQTYFQWHTENLSARIHNMCEYLRFTPDYSERSLISLWDRVIRRYPRMKKEDMTVCVVNGCALYLGEVFIRNNAGLRWECCADVPLQEAFRNRPVVAGFFGKESTPPVPLVFEPMYMITGPEGRILRGEASATDVYDLYRKWLQYTPDGEQTHPTAREAVAEAVRNATGGKPEAE